MVLCDREINMDKRRYRRSRWNKRKPGLHTYFFMMSYWTCDPKKKNDVLKVCHECWEVTRCNPNKLICPRCGHKGMVKVSKVELV